MLDFGLGMDPSDVIFNLYFSSNVMMLLVLLEFFCKTILVHLN